MSISERRFISTLSNTSSDEDLVQAAKVVAASNNNENVCELASVLARSGHMLDGWPSSLVADIPSTGGPFSLSTLLCPLILAAAGCYVPKLGVPGRPAGGIDCMMQLPGYRATFDEDELHSIVAETRYAHFLSGGRFAPLDARMFSLRQRHGLQSVAALAAASILSKKIAVGVRKVGLDIRVAPWGNFGHDMAAAKVAADIFVDCAKMLGLSAFTFLTDATQPYQPYLGRSESLLAMSKILDGSADGLLAAHAGDCLSMAATLSSGEDVPTWASARKVLSRHLEAQGADIDSFEELAAHTAAQHKRQIVASNGGSFRPNIPALRDVFVQAQETCKALQPAKAFPDPMGLILSSPAGEKVYKGQVLATVRADDATWLQFGEAVEAALVVREN